MCMQPKQNGHLKAEELNIALFDANSYFASCHQAVDPGLRGKPVIVAGDPKNRSGIVLTASHEARCHGIKTAMPVQQALRYCPDALLIRPNFPLYLDLSEKMWRIVERYTDSDHIQVVSIDECFADFQGSHRLFGSTIEIARRVQREIWEELNLGISVGISYGKTFAKLASEYTRDPHTGIKIPRSFTCISLSDFREKVWPLPVGELSGVGRKMQGHLHALHISTIGDLARTSETQLIQKFGVIGQRLYQWANGVDPRPVQPDVSNANHSLGRMVTLSHDLLEPDQVAQVLLTLADSVGRKVRKEKSKTRTVTLTIKDATFQSHSFSISLPEPTDLTEKIYDVSYALYVEKWQLTGRPIRLLGISVSNLQSGIEQLSIFNEEDVSASKLTQTVDALRDRFGTQAVLKATQLLLLGENIRQRKE